MSDDVLIDTGEKDKRHKMAMGAAILLLIMGVFAALTYRNYLDIGHVPVFILYALFNFLVFRALKKARIVMALVSIGLVALLLFVALAKVQWNRNYLQSLTTSNAFILEDYIERYPRMEEYYFSWVLRQPDWIRFADQCVSPALQKRPVQTYCRSPQAIRERFRINLMAEIHDYMAKMQETATRIKEGRIKSSRDYQRCLAQKQCVPVPLLPDGVDPEKIAQDAMQHTDVRLAFWDLVDKRGLTPHVCGSMVLCRAMAMSGAVGLNQPANGQNQDQP